MKKRTVIISLLVVAILLLLFLPIPTGTYDDGGTREYIALTYKIVCWNRIMAEPYTESSDKTFNFYDKTQVYWFGDSTKSIGELWEPIAAELKEGYTVVSIVDNTEDADDAIETFYSDSEYVYTFPRIKSHSVIVTYKNGSTQNVKNALQAGHITVADLDRFGIEYYKSLSEPYKVVAITDNNPPTDPTMDNLFLQTFYSDGEYYYSFYGKSSHLFQVTYKNGTTQQLNQALQSGKVAISDLDVFGIQYEKDPISNNESYGIKSIVDTSTVAPDALEVFYSDSEYVYTFPSIISENVMVYYTNGYAENVVSALKAGRIKITDLDVFEIFYMKSPIT